MGDKSGRLEVRLGQPASLVPQYLEGHAPAALRAGQPLAPAAGATYYGQPPIKKPHWKWQVPTYFWCGGIAAGSHLVALLADLADRAAERPLVRWGRYATLLALAASPILLIADLGRPERFHHMLRIVKPRSMISLGTWILTLFGACSGALGLAQLVEDLGPRPWAAALRRPARALGLLSAPFAVLLAIYPGALLAATAVAFWARGRLYLAPLFFSSALATGASAVALGARPADRSARRRLGQVIAAALGVELTQSLLLERHLSPAGHCLAAGAPARLHRASQVLGLLLPLALLLPPALGGRAPGRLALALAALATLVGGYAMRWAIVTAGKRSAERPSDYFDWTRATTQGEEHVARAVARRGSVPGTSP